MQASSGTANAVGMPEVQRSVGPFNIALCHLQPYTIMQHEDEAESDVTQGASPLAITLGDALRVEDCLQLQSQQLKHVLNGTKTLRFINASVCDLAAFKTTRRCDLKRCDLGALEERGQCDLGNCVPKRSVSNCDLRFRAAI